MEQARALARQALAAQTVSEIRELITERHLSRVAGYDALADAEQDFSFYNQDRNY